MRKITALIAAMLATGGVQAQVYKCTDPVTGQLTFSQIPCATEAQTIDVDVHRPSAEQVDAHRQQWESNQQFIDEGQARRRAQLEAAAQERRQQRQLEALEAEHAQRLAEIEAQRARAANNQAGATYLQSLSQDEANANARYQAELDRLRGMR